MTLELRAWTAADVAVLLRDNTAEMTAYLGGPEAEEVVRDRHARFLRGQDAGTTWPFTVWSDDVAEPIGAVTYWSGDYADAPAYEAAWAIGSAFQGRGFGGRAVRMMLEHAVQHGDRDRVWAFPRIDNGASNGIARSAGFELTGEVDSEYPKGVPIRVNAWVYAVTAHRAAGDGAHR